ncbi:MAG: rhomboid family intramembrane serine protease [Armatimonadota bacterium]
MLLPYRVKNPPKKFPVVTVSLIAINVIVYIFTTDSLLRIREDVLDNYAFALGTSPFLNFISAVFLHANLFHLLGNMLFLWVFGPPVEDRLGVGKYLLVYFATGLAGGLLESAIEFAVTGKTYPGIGASGCIMGILGAYWYIYSWSTVCVFYFFWVFIRPYIGVWEVAAIWIIGLFFLMDLLEGVLFGVTGVSGGVANFAHIGGACAGALLCLALRIKRDTESVSEAKAIQADMKDLSLMPAHALEAMLEHDPANIDIIKAMAKPGLSNSQNMALERAFINAAPLLVDKDPAFVMYYLMTLRRNIDLIPSMYLLRLARTMERSAASRDILSIYGRIIQRDPMSPDAETALYRMAEYHLNVHGDKESTKNCLRELAKRFPNGPMTQFGRILWNRATQPTQHQ